MKRSGFARKPFQAVERPERTRAPTIPLTRAVVYARISQDAANSAPKADVARSEKYLRLVSARPCIHCGIAGPSQAAHSDYGKGAHIKADDRTCYPLCAAQPGRLGCHDRIGSSGEFTKEKRRVLELSYAAATRAAITAEGGWPEGLAAYPSCDVVASL
jgi:hypothetical protein